MMDFGAHRSSQIAMSLNRKQRKVPISIQNDISSLNPFCGAVGR